MDPRQRLEELRGRKRLEELRAKAGQPAEAPKSEDKGVLNAINLGAQQGLTLEHADEGKNSLYQYLLKRKGMDEDPSYLETVRKEYDSARENHPWAFGLSKFGGAVLPWLTGAGEAAAALSLPEVAAVGVGTGILHRTGEQEATPENKSVVKAVTEHPIATVADAAIPVAAQKYSPAVISWLTSKFKGKNPAPAVEAAEAAGREFEDVAGTVTKSKSMEDLERIKAAAQRPDGGEMSPLESMATGETPIEEASEDLTRKMLEMATTKEKNLGQTVKDFRGNVEALPEQEVADVNAMLQKAKGASEYEKKIPSWEEKNVTSTKLKYNKEGDVSGTTPYRTTYLEKTEDALPRTSFSTKTVADLDTLIELHNKGKISAKDALKAADDMDNAIKWDSENPSIPKEVRSAYVEARDALKARLHGQLEGYGEADKAYSDLVTNMSAKLNKGQKPTPEEVEGARKYLFDLLDKDKKSVSRNWFEKTFGKEGQALLKQARDTKIAMNVRKGGDVPTNNPAYKTFKQELYEKLMQKYRTRGAVMGGTVGATLGESMIPGFGVGGAGGAISGGYAGKNIASMPFFVNRAERIAGDQARKMIDPSYIFELARKAGVKENEAKAAVRAFEKAQEIAEQYGEEAARKYWLTIPISQSFKDLIGEQ